MTVLEIILVSLFLPLTELDSCKKAAIHALKMFVELVMSLAKIQPSSVNEENKTQWLKGRPGNMQFMLHAIE